MSESHLLKTPGLHCHFPGSGYPGSLMSIAQTDDLFSVSVGGVASGESRGKSSLNLGQVCSRVALVGL